MAFRVEISPEALRDLDEISEYIGDRANFSTAERWFNGMFAAIRTLSELPHRCPVAGESEDFEAEVRLLLHGKRNRRYRVYFAIHDETQTVPKELFIHGQTRFNRQEWDGFSSAVDQSTSLAGVRIRDDKSLRPISLIREMLFSGQED